MEQKYSEGQHVTILYNDVVILTTITRVELDENINEYIYYFNDSNYFECFCYENDIRE